jgi:hypothetical protein
MTALVARKTERETTCCTKWRETPSSPMEVRFYWQASTISDSHVIFEIIVVSVENVNRAYSKELFCPRICGGQRDTGTRFSSSTCVSPVCIVQPVLRAYSFIYHRRCKIPAIDRVGKLPT